MKGTMNDRIDRILALLDVGEQHTTQEHYGSECEPTMTEPEPGDLILFASNGQPIASGVVPLGEWVTARAEWTYHTDPNE